MIRDGIKEVLKKALKDLGVEDFEPQIERPKDSSNGDYSTNVAMNLFTNSRFMIKDSGSKNPMELAEKIIYIQNTKYKIQNTDFEKIVAVKPGFINFYLSNSYLQTQVGEIINKADNYGLSALGKGKKASVEYVSANPTGPLHIGNARGGPLGDALANVLEKAGYEVTREYLHNNVGGQVARLGEAIYFTLHPDQKGEGYEIQYQGEYIKELAKMVEETMEEKHFESLSQEEFIDKAGQIAVEMMLLEILKDCEDMGIKFDLIRKESDLRKDAPEVIKELEKKGLVKEKDGALWFAPNDEFLKDRETVVKKSDGEYTYFASDIVYHKEKFKKGNDLVVDILGANHSGHVPRLKAVIKALGFDTNEFKVVLYQWIRLKRGEEILKMSKRSGTFVTAREVLDEVGKDAFRFFLLRTSSETHMDFDLELAKKKANENPVFYVQYAYSRINSIFSKAEETISKPDTSLLIEPEEVALIRQLLKFPELIEEVSYTFAVNTFTTYVIEVATLFHKFYETHKVISDDKKITQARLGLLKATAVVLKNTLDLLGVSAPAHM